jgi:hypothetical protein
MDERDLASLVDDVARAMTAADPSPAFGEAVLGRIGTRRHVRTTYRLAAAAGLALAVVAALVRGSLVKDGSISRQGPVPASVAGHGAGSRLADPAAAVTAAASDIAAAGRPDRRSRAGEAAAGQTAERHLAPLEGLARIDFDPIQPNPVRLPPIERGVVTIDPIRIAPLDLVPLIVADQS